MSICQKFLKSNKGGDGLFKFNFGYCGLGSEYLFFEGIPITIFLELETLI